MNEKATPFLRMLSIFFSWYLRYSTSPLSLNILSDSVKSKRALDAMPITSFLSIGYVICFYRLISSYSICKDKKIIS